MANDYNIADVNELVGTVTGDVTGNLTGNVTGEINGAKLDSNATGVGFHGTTPAAKPGATADIKDSLVGYGMITDGGATPLNLDGGQIVVGSVVSTAGMQIIDAGNLVLGSTTGSKIGTATTQKLSFYNATPVVQPTAYTQTFATADKTHDTRTSAATATDAATLASYGYTETQANAIVTNLNAVRADLADTAACLNSLIDDLQALGLIG